MGQVSSCVLRFLRAAVFCQRAPSCVCEYLCGNCTKDPTLNILPGSSYSSLCLSSAVFPKFVLCIADLTHFQIGPDGGKNRKRRKGGGKERETETERTSLLCFLMFALIFLENHFSFLSPLLFYNKSAYFYSGMSWH